MIRTTTALIVFAGSLSLALAALVSEGLLVDIAGVEVTARNPARPFVVAGLAATLLVAWWPRFARLVTRLAELSKAERAPTIAVVAMAAGVACVGVLNGSFVASAADSYGYVLEAKLFARGALSVPQEWARSFAWPNAEGAWSPLGFRPSPDGASIVPAYPPGFPLAMSVFWLIGGDNAGYLVVPAAAAIIVLATFWLGRGVDGPATGLMAALLIACSPTLLFHACVPMSDVPATAASTVALAVSLRRSNAAALASGLCAGLMVLIRPNLIPLLAVPAIAILTAAEAPRRSRLRPLVLFAAGVLPSLVVLALLNREWYGSPLSSGYPVNELFRLEYLHTNAFSYPRWLIETQTPFVMLAPLGLFVVRRYRVLLATVLAIVALCYAFYVPFDHWTYLRFLLPAIPVLVILASACATRAIAAASSAPAKVCALTVVGVVALTSWQEARIRGAFQNHVSVERFVTIPRFARAELPERAIFLTRLYSGSMREYGERLTVRWDVLDPQWLDRAIEDLHARQYVVFIVIEADEEKQLFRDRFGATSRWGALDWPPAAEYRGVETVWLYDVRDVERSPEAVPGRVIPR
jgi:hypothetical protein